MRPLLVRTATITHPASESWPALIVTIQGINQNGETEYSVTLRMEDRQVASRTHKKNETARDMLRAFTEMEALGYTVKE